MVIILRSKLKNNTIFFILKSCAYFTFYIKNYFCIIFGLLWHNFLPILFENGNPVCFLTGGFCCCWFSWKKSKLPEKVARFAAFSNVDVIKTCKASYINDKMDFEEIESYSEGLYLDVLDVLFTIPKFVLQSHTLSQSYTLKYV